MITKLPWSVRPGPALPAVRAVIRKALVVERGETSIEYVSVGVAMPLAVTVPSGLMDSLAFWAVTDWTSRGPSIRDATGFH